MDRPILQHYPRDGSGTSGPWKNSSWFSEPPVKDINKFCSGRVWKSEGIQLNFTLASPLSGQSNRIQPTFPSADSSDVNPNASGFSKKTNLRYPQIQVVWLVDFGFTVPPYWREMLHCVVPRAIWPKKLRLQRLQQSWSGANICRKMAGGIDKGLQYNLAPITWKMGREWVNSQTGFILDMGLEQRSNQQFVLVSTSSLPHFTGSSNWPKSFLILFKMICRMTCQSIVYCISSLLWICVGQRYTTADTIRYPQGSWLVGCFLNAVILAPGS